MEVQVYRRLCEILRLELYRLGSTEESVSSLWSSSDLEQNKLSPLPNGIKRPGNVTNVRRKICSIFMCGCEKAKFKFQKI